MTATAKLFFHGRSQAVRLPKDVAFGRDVEVTIVRSGDVLTIFPRRRPIGDLIARLANLTQPADIERRDDDLPERSGL